VHTSTKARLTSVAIRIRICIRIPDSLEPDRHQNLNIILFTGPLQTFAENFTQIRLEVFAQSSSQTNKQTDKQRRLHVPLELWRR